MRNIIIFSVLVLFIGAAAESCNEKEKSAPSVPPESAFVMDMSDFDDEPPEKETYKNFAYSVTTVSVWHTLLSVGLAVPVASYREALNNHDPVYQSDETWLWSYDFSIGEALFSANLYGTVANDSVDWKMYITREGEYKDFLWYKGKSALDRSGGYWLLYESPANDVELLDITWERNEDTTGNIKYTNIKQGSTQNGGYILYGNDETEGPYKNFYDIYNKGKAQLTEIEWNKETNAGRVRDTVHFGDELWHCWDEMLQDADCPAE